MPEITDSLFAHIQNDSALLGTSGLEGNRFSNTAEYLKGYIKKLSGEGVVFPKAYSQLLEETTYLTKVEQDTDAILHGKKPLEEVANIAKKVCADVRGLPVGGKLLLPGGWVGNPGGHAMLYQITRTENGYDFTVINAGAGLQYHAKKSSTDRDLYNPIKKWHFSIPKENPEIWNAEMQIFIKRLIEARLLPKDGNLLNEDKLYSDHLTGIARIGAVEVDASIGIKNHWYTGSQISGTCSQRCLHQMLKINTDNPEDYKQFIFKFKLHALHDYANACFTGKQPFSPAVAHQIKIAIYNNLKILNNLSLKEDEIQKLAEELTQLKLELGVNTFIDYANSCLSGKQPFNAAVAEKLRIAIDDNLKIVNKSSLKPDQIQRYVLLLNQSKTKLYKLTADLTKEKASEPPEEQPNFVIRLSHYSTNRTLKVNNNVTDYQPEDSPQINFNNGKKLLDNLDDMIKKIGLIGNSATQYNALEQLLRTLPFNELANNPNNEFSSPFYKELRTLEHYEKFQKQINTIQQLVFNLKCTWLQRAQTPTFHAMVLSLMSLQMDTHQVINKLTGLPTGKNIADSVMYSMIAHCEKDPFWATNNPEYDQKLVNLQKRYQFKSKIDGKDMLKHYQEIIATPGFAEANKALKKQYTALYGQDISEPHLAIRKQGLESLFLIVEMINEGMRDENYKIPPEYEAIVKKIQLEMDFDAELRKNINCTLGHYGSVQPYIILDPKGLLKTALEAPVFDSSPNQFGPYKYLKTNESVRKALKEYNDDAWGASANESKRIRRTANTIQTEFSSQYALITQEEIDSRDYRHLRGNSELQILLTLDYFTRNIGKLASRSDQEYVEANIFEPGLLLKASTAAGFHPQLDKFLNTGIRFFTLNGQHTPNSLFYLRLDYQISRYLALMPGNTKGLDRLKTLQKELMKQLDLSNTPDVTYALQEMLFLNLMTQIEQGADAGELFTTAMRAHFYLHGHTNPQMFNDVAHDVEVCKATACFQQLAARQPENIIINAVKETLKDCSRAIPPHLQLKGKYPSYSLVDADNKPLFEYNAFQGKLFEANLARSGVPLTIQNHQLIKHLGLQDVKECLMSADQRYLELPHAGGTVALYHNERQNSLTAKKIWNINGEPKYYELLALTSRHVAKSANVYLDAVGTSLPAILTDASMEYWFNDSPPATGILTQNNVPVYSVKNEVIKLLDAKGVETAYQLKPLDPQLHQRLIAFESAHFLLHHSSPVDSVINLPRYNLSFTHAVGSSQLIHKPTGEHIVSDSFPIHPKVASLVLENNAKLSRCLIPVARFYATGAGGEASDFSPAVHDTKGTIGAAYDKGLPWHYQNSEHYISYQLKNGEPVAETTADALYLVYLYLSTNQPEKAWKMLEECTTRLGGLTGSPEELKYISWISNDLPHIFPLQANVKSRETPPYVACKLKTMALLSDYLQQGGQFNLKPSDTIRGTANDQIALKQHQDLNNFLSSFPEKVYHSFCHLQKMRRHLESPYFLSIMERKRLLDYYHQSQSTGAMGALGYEWMSLNLEALLQEQDRLLARQSAINGLSPADQKRLDFIQKRFKDLKPVMAVSTELQLVDIDLTLSSMNSISQFRLSQKTTEELEKWERDLPKPALGEPLLNRALEALSDINRNDDTLLNYFPAYLEIAQSANDKQKKILHDFCTKTLIAQRHVPLDNQTSNIPLLCNVLYRILENKPLFARAVAERTQHYSLSFSDIVSIVSRYEVPALKVYQATDVYKGILASPEQLASQPRPEQRPLVNPKIQYQTLIIHTGIPKSLDQIQNDQLNKVLKEFQDLQRASTAAISALGASSNDNSQQLAIEEQAGLLRLELAKAKNKAAADFIKNVKLTGTTIEAIKNAEKIASPLLEKAWEAALSLANQGPKFPIAARKWRIEKEANSRAPLTKADLLALYCRADTANSIEKTGLVPEDTQRLHELIHTAMVQGIQHNWLNKIISNFEAAITEKDVNKASMALDLLSRKEIPGLDNPATVIIQHEQDIVLHERQVNSLQALLEPPNTDKPFNELIDKTIPGGGKSKVILPIISEKKANGTNLVVIEVPRSLLATNFVDLNRESQRLFGKKAYIFEFNRDSDSSPKRLEELYKMFTEIMINKAYLVTTGEAIQSLELKYLELLTQGDTQNKDWQQQVYWLDKITGLFLNHADCIIDEAHQGLSIKKKLNYTTGEPAPISSTQIKNSLALFNLIDIGFIKNARFLDTNYNWAPFKQQLATKLVTDPSSPLYEFVVKARVLYGQGIDNELIAYLTNQANDQHAVISTASAEIKAALGLFKREINVILPQTLPRKLGAHYGPSKIPGLSAIEKTLGIPYEGNDTPNERSRFGNTIEASNYMIQMMLIEGLSKDLVKQRVAIYIAEARKELFLDKSLKNIDETLTAQGFTILAPGLKLSEINLDNPIHLDALHKVLQHNRTLINQQLELSLKLIKNDAAILPSDSFNHVDLYRTTQGVTGTPNPTTYHQRLGFDNTISLGTDGYVTNVILDKKTPTFSSDCDSVKQFLENSLSSSPDHTRCRAIIDINATFTGKTNYVVAAELAEFILKYPERFNKTIKHILYFNEKNVLCAIDPNKPKEPITIGTSDPEVIERILGSKPDERFTYYDQAHTVGTDIKQGKNSHALVLVDDKTSLQAFIQGSMRMRELALDQTLELVVPVRNKSMNCKQLIEQFAANDKKDLAMDNLFAAKAKLTNYLRRNLLTRIQDLPSEQAHEKRELAEHFRSFFIEAPSDDLFELYGAINKEQATVDILTRSYTQLSKRWVTSLNAAGIRPTPGELAEVDAALKKIIATALPHCLPRYEGLDDSLSLEVEVQKEVQKQVQVQLLTLNEFQSANIEAEDADKWAGIKDPFSESHFVAEAYKRAGRTLPLNTLCGFAKGSPLFSSQLIASRNYAYSCKYQDQVLGAYLKPVFLIWYHLDSNNKLQAMIVTPQEAAELTGSSHMSNSWLSTTQDALIAGKRPDNIHLREDYQRIREQVRFFNGEFNLLLNQDTPLLWLKEKADEKIKFFENKLLAYRTGCAQSLDELKIGLRQTDLKGFDYIANHPFADLTQYDWRILDPNLMGTQIKEYQKLAKAFKYLNTHWMTLPDGNETVLEQLQTEYQLPVSNLPYLTKHLDKLRQFKSLFDIFKKPMDKPLLLASALSAKKDRESLEESMGITIKALLAQYGVNNMEQSNLPAKDAQAYQLASIQSFILVRQHPAVYDKKPIDQMLLTIAKQTQSIEVLLLLAGISDSPKELLTLILNHSLCNDLVRTKILGAANESVLIDLVNYEPVAQDAPWVNTFELGIVNHPRATDKVITAILNKKSYSESIFVAILKKASEHVLIRLINKEFVVSGLPDSVISHPNTTDKVMAAIIKQDMVSSPDMALAILKQKPNKINSDTLPLFAGQILAQCQKTGLNSPWGAPFSLLVSQALANPDTKDLMIKFIQEKIQKVRDIGFMGEQRGNNVVRYLPMQSIIKAATQDELTTLVTLDLAKEFSDEILESIYNHAFVNANILDKIAKNPSVSNKVLFAVLQHPKATPAAPKEILSYLRKPLTTKEQCLYVIDTFVKLGQDLESNEKEKTVAINLFLNENSRTDENKKNLFNFMKWLKVNPAFIEPYLGLLATKTAFKLNEFMELAKSGKPGINKKLEEEPLLNALSIMKAKENWQAGMEYLDLVAFGATEGAKQYLVSKEITNVGIDKLKQDCMDCIEVIEKASWHPNDSNTYDYCLAMKETVGILSESSASNLEKCIVLSHKLQQLNHIKTSVTSKEMQFIKKEYERLEKGVTTFWGDSFKKKVNAINQAVFNVPLDKRGEIFSREEDPHCNAVRLAFAIRRTSPFSALDSTGLHVDPDKAATSFTNIKNALLKEKSEAQQESDELRPDGYGID